MDNGSAIAVFVNDNRDNDFIIRSEVDSITGLWLKCSILGKKVTYGI
jgi:hypothetical protein